MEAINNTLGMKIPRNFFDLSQVHGFTCKAGYIYPIFMEILMPGDLIKVNNQCVIRQLPTINPTYSQFKVKFWDMVVAIRNLDKNIYRFMSGFQEYTNEVAYTEALPRWIPSDISKTRPGTLWDFMQNPINCIPDEDSCQLDYFRQAYGYIWDIYFRNEARQETILNELHEPGSWKGEDLLRVNWDRDYLTTCLPKQQLGEPGAIPLTGIGSAVWSEEFDKALDNPKGVSTRATNISGLRVLTGPTRFQFHNTGLIEGTEIEIPGMVKNREEFKEYLNKNNINFGTAGTILISQIRELIALQCMSEINAISGIRDEEFLQGNWGERPSNEALQYPEIFGKEVAYITTNEVLQTSQSTEDSQLGEMGGHGLSVSAGNQHKFYAKEFSIYMKLMYIKPETLYGKQGAKRKFTQKTKYDFPFPQLNHISMQPVYSREILCASTKKPMGTINKNNGNLEITAGNEDTTASTYNSSIQGFVNNFQWYKENQNIISGAFNQEQYYDTDANTVKTYENLSNWTEARFFSIKDGERPQVNNDFLQCKPDKRNYNLTEENDDEFLVWHNNIVKAWRPMSLIGMPSSLGMVGGL